MMDNFTARHLAEYAAMACNDNIADAGFVGWVHALDDDDLEYYERHGWPVALRHYRELVAEQCMGGPVKHLYSEGETS